MAYENRDANLIKSYIEGQVIEHPSSVTPQEALAALDRLVHDYLPEAESIRRLLARDGQAQRPAVWIAKIDDGSIILRTEPNGSITTIITRDDGGPALRITGGPSRSLEDLKAAYDADLGPGGLKLNWIEATG